MTIKEELALVCKTKESVIKLNNDSLKKYKVRFYSKPYKVWQLDLLWEFIWNDISLEEIKNILKIGE